MNKARTTKSIINNHKPTFNKKGVETLRAINTQSQIAGSQENAYQQPGYDNGNPRINAGPQGGKTKMIIALGIVALVVIVGVAFLAFSGTSSKYGALSSLIPYLATKKPIPILTLANATSALQSQQHNVNANYTGNYRIAISSPLLSQSALSNLVFSVPFKLNQESTDNLSRSTISLSLSNKTGSSLFSAYAIVVMNLTGLKSNAYSNVSNNLKFACFNATSALVPIYTTTGASLAQSHLLCISGNMLKTLQEAEANSTGVTSLNLSNASAYLSGINVTINSYSLRSVRNTPCLFFNGTINGTMTALGNQLAKELNSSGSSGLGLGSLNYTPSINGYFSECVSTANATTLNSTLNLNAKISIFSLNINGSMAQVSSNPPVPAAQILTFPQNAAYIKYAQLLPGYCLGSTVSGFYAICSNITANTTGSVGILYDITPSFIYSFNSTNSSSSATNITITGLYCSPSSSQGGFSYQPQSAPPESNFSSTKIIINEYQPTQLSFNCGVKGPIGTRLNVTLWGMVYNGTAFNETELATISGYINTNGTLPVSYSSANQSYYHQNITTTTVIGGGRLPSTFCIASSGYLCQNYTYSAATGNFTATIGQATGSDWTNATFGFQPNSVPLYNSSIPSFPDGTSIPISSLNSSQIAEVSIPVSGPVPAGTTQSGTLWAEYQMYGGTYYSEIASVDMSAS